MRFVRIVLAVWLGATVVVLLAVPVLRALSVASATGFWLLLALVFCLAFVAFLRLLPGSKAPVSDSARRIVMAAVLSAVAYFVAINVASAISTYGERFF